MSTSLAAGRPSPFVTAVDRIVANPRTVHSVYALEVYDLDAKRPLFVRNAQTFATAGSTTKLVTEGTSLALLGPDFRWTTPVYRSGTVDDAGTLHGNLILVGSGDPNLSQRIQPGGTLRFENEDHSYGGSAVPGNPLAVLEDLARQIRTAGIRRVDGRVITDASLFPESTEGGTGLTVSPVIVNDNAIDVTIAPGTHPGDPATLAVSPQTGYVRFVDRVTTSAATTASTVDMSDDVTDSDGVHHVTITGTQPAGPSVLYPYGITNPALFASVALTQALGDAGVPVTGMPHAVETPPPGDASPYAAANLVAEHVSPPLAEDVLVTLKVSQNLHAHLMPFMWGAYAARARSDILTRGFAAGAATLARSGVDLNGAVIQGGEGAGALFTPDWMVRYLAWARRQRWFPAFFRGLPILGVDGTLARIQTSSPARGKVFAKTGTDGSSNALRADQMISKGLAGYMTTSHGRHVAFAFYLDHIEGPANENTSDVAGQILGSLATATFEKL